MGEGSTGLAPSATESGIKHNGEQVAIREFDPKEAMERILQLAKDRLESPNTAVLKHIPKDIEAPDGYTQVIAIKYRGTSMTMRI